MTSYFSLFVLMLSITIGMNVLAGAFINSPAFEELGTVEEREILFGKVRGADIPEELSGAFQEGEVDCSVIRDEQGAVSTNPDDIDTLLEEICNPSKQTITTTSTTINNITTSTSAIETTERAKVGSLAQKVSSEGQISIFDTDNVIAALTGEFILRAVAGAFFGFCSEQNDPSCDPDSQLPQEFVDGFRVIVLLMFIGMILSLLFGRSLATAG